MAGKYISIDQAATRLNKSVDELNRMRERGELRGFADRGTWKFRVDDIEEIARQLQVDSDPDFEIMFGEESDSEVPTEQDAVVMMDEDSDSDVKLVSDSSTDDQNLSPIDLTVDDDSDSDVSLVSGVHVPDLSTDSPVVMMEDSDSDVRLVSDSSNVQPDDSAQHLGEIDLTDDDVSNFADGGGDISDSDVRLVGSVESDIRTIPDSDLSLSDDSSSVDSSDSRTVLAQNLDNNPRPVISPNEGVYESDSDVKIVGQSPATVKGDNSQDDSDDDSSKSDVTLLGESGSVVMPYSQISGVDKLIDSGDAEFMVDEDDDDDASDVQLVEDTPDEPQNPAAISGLQVGSDLTFTESEEGESDVRLLSDVADPEPDSDSDVQLVPDKYGEDDSGLTLEPYADSGLTLEGPADSEVSILADEGSQLYGGSGINLAADSGISLDLAADSGISLASDAFDEDGLTLAGDSGITLEASDSGLTLSDDDDDVERTVPMMNLQGAVEEGSGETTAFDFDLDEETEEDETYQLASAGDDETNVITFDDEDSSELEAPTTMKRGTETPEEEDSVFDLGTIDEVDMDDEDDIFDDDELEISDDILGEDDEVDDLDIFDSSADEEFVDEFESTGSEPEYAAPMMRGGAAAPAEWGIGSFMMVTLCTLIMVPATLVMFELVHSMWAFQQPITPNNFILDTLASLYKN